MVCDMCGSSGKLYKATIEGAELTVCQKCSNFGKVISVIKQEEPRRKIVKDSEFKEPENEVMQLIAGDYAEKIRKEREHMGLKQEEFAKKIGEKESLIQKMESGHFEPSIDLAKKIEHFLRIKLVEDFEEKHEAQKGSRSDTFTIGDFIKIKKK